jgi:hypothetical protein
MRAFSASRRYFASWASSSGADVLEVGGRVGHRVVEEQPVQLVGQVVVRRDVALRLAEPVGPQGVDQLVARDVEQRRRGDRAAAPAVGDDDAEQRHEVVDDHSPAMYDSPTPTDAPVTSRRKNASRGRRARRQLRSGSPKSRQRPSGSTSRDRPDRSWSSMATPRRRRRSAGGRRPTGVAIGRSRRIDSSGAVRDRPARGPSGRWAGRRWNGVRRHHSRTACRWIR